MPPPHPPLDKLRAVWSSRSPLLLFALNSALAAGLSWELVSSLLGVEAAALAVVSAVIVVQVTSWQTVRKSIERILGVIVGVSLAVLVAHLLGLNFWTITLMIFFAQVIGLVRQMRRIAYTITEPEPAWLELAQKQDWALAYAGLLEEMGSALRSLVAYIHSSATSQSNDLPDRENLRTQADDAFS